MLTPIKNSFKTIVTPVIAAGMALSMAFAPSAMAGKDLQNETTRIVQLLGQRLSHDKLTFVVQGGEKEQQMAVYRAAQRLDDEGIPVALLLARSPYKTKGLMSVLYYTKGGTQYNSLYGSGVDSAQVEQGIYEHAKKAYNEFFLPVLALK